MKPSYSMTMLAAWLWAVVVHAEELALSRVSDHTIALQVTAGGSRVAISPMLVTNVFEEVWRGPVTSAPPTLKTGPFRVEIQHEPLRLTVRRENGSTVQELAFTGHAPGSLSFLTPQAVLGLGQNGSKFDRRGILHPMIARYGGSTQGSIIPSPLLIGVDGWALFIPQPQGSFDLRDGRGTFSAGDAESPLQIFVMAWENPADVLTEYVRLTGHAALPPKWALGYMQSHRTLAGPQEIRAEASTFRDRKLPCDALIYLGTGYCPAGWNRGHGSPEFNPKTFDQPADILRALHDEQFKVVMHVNRAPQDLHGTAVAEVADGPNHINAYWQRHRSAFGLGIDGWWPDDGDELPLPGRIARHRCYFEGPLADRPDVRPWSLHRTGGPGMMPFGGWIWSGDIDSSWATLAHQIPVGLAASLSLTPFWGTDTGGFVPKKEYTGELYVRWFQFSAFCPSFRSHGRTWHLHTPFGWNTGEPGPVEGKELCDASEFHNERVEPICRRFLNLRYQLLPYNYTIAREACDTGMPMMRALWLHHPDEAASLNATDEFLWGRNLLVAPVVAKGARERQLYLPRGTWFDWWTGDKRDGGVTITRPVELDMMPLFVRAGSIIPFDPIRQYTGQTVDMPTELRIYPGSDGEFTLYDDDGASMRYLKDDGLRIRMSWNDAAHTLTLAPANIPARTTHRRFLVRIMPGETSREVSYQGETTSIPMGPQ